MPPKKLKKSKKAAQTEAWLAAVAASQKRTNEQLQDKAVSKVSSALAIQTNRPANKSQMNTLMDFSFSSLPTLSSSFSLSCNKYHSYSRCGVDINVGILSGGSQPRDSFYERLSEVDYQLCIILKPVRESGEILQESMNHGQTRDRSYEPKGETDYRLCINDVTSNVLRLIII